MVRDAFILLTLLVSKAVMPATAPKAETPLVLTLRQSVGMAPLTVRVKVRAAAVGREVCVVVEGPESFRSCRQLDGVTWTLDFVLRTGGEYIAFATSQQYRTAEIPVTVIGLGERP